MAERDERAAIQVTKSRSQSMAARQQQSRLCSQTGSILSAGDLHKENGGGGCGGGCVCALSHVIHVIVRAYGQLT